MALSAFFFAVMAAGAKLLGGRIGPQEVILYEEISALPVVDAHEHLPAEADYLAKQYSGLNMFAGGYIWHDLESAGLSPAFCAMPAIGFGGPGRVDVGLGPMRQIVVPSVATMPMKSRSV